jgi:hypothetical protein
MTLADEMAALAEVAATECEGLDFSLASLKVLEAHIAGRPCAEASTRTWGAYLGETMRRCQPDAVSWADYQTAVSALPMIGKLGYGPDLSAILMVRKQAWFPLSKIEKFQKNGATDALAPFAQVALAAVVVDPNEAAREAKRRADAQVAVDVAAAAFRAEPSTETLLQLGKVLHSSVYNHLHGETVRRIELRVDELTPWLDRAPSGRGYKRIYPGLRAADLIAMVLCANADSREASVATLRARLGDKSKTVREHVAFALAYSELHDGRAEVALELAAHRDRATATGAWAAIRSLAGDIRMGYERTLEITALAPAFTEALTATSPHVEDAIDALASWSFSPERGGVLVPFASALIALLDAPKKSVAASAAKMVERYVWATVHGRAPYDAQNVERLRGRSDGVARSPLARLTNP